MIKLILLYKNDFQHVPQKCPLPLRPKKKTMFKEIYTGKWKCVNPNNGKKYNTTDLSLSLPPGTKCQVSCNQVSEMPTPKAHGSIYCGPRGWYSTLTSEHILNELPTIPGAPDDGSKKDPEVFNLMPVCKMVRCMAPPSPPNAEYFLCDNAETLDYMPYKFRCELRCKTGYYNPGPTFSTCWNGGFMKGYKDQKCEKIAPEELDQKSIDIINGDAPLELIFDQVKNI